MRRPIMMLAFVLAIAAAVPAATPANPLRGPSGQGHFQDDKVPLTWSDSENLLWKTALPGVGNSTPAIVGDRIFLTSSSPKGEERFVICLRASNGEVLWKQTASKGGDAGRTHAMNGYASPSCAVDDTHVYAFFGTPGLFCYDFEGKLIWKRDFGLMTTDTGWGIAASPVLFENLVIQNCDNSGVAGLPKGQDPKGVGNVAAQALIALDKKTGEVKWTADRNQGKGFSTPVLMPMPGGRTDLVLNGPFGVWAYDPRSGKELWHCERHKGDGKALFGEAVPVFDQEKLVAMSGRPGPMIAVRLGGTGDVTKTHIAWDVMRKTPRDVNSPILWKDLLYIGDRDGNLTCHDMKDGKVIFKERAGKKCFSASPISVQGKLLFLTEDGLTVVVEPARELKVVGRNALKDPTEFRASPVIADGRLYLRSQSTLYCIGKK
jgi:outer membrane protein assembly factor BamB